MEYQKLNSSLQEVSSLGFGCWAIGGHGYGTVDDNESKKAIAKAIESGVNFFDTADVYGFGKSESLLAEALGNKIKNVIVASKGGVRWNAKGETVKDCSPKYLRQAVERSLSRLRLECIPLYYIHWPDEKTPVEDSVGELGLLKKEGKIGAIGVSNFSSEQIKRALSSQKIEAAQVQYNMLQREKALDIIRVCKENNILIVAWGALGDGLLTGKFTSDSRFSEGDHRRKSSEFQGEKFITNLEIVEKINELSLEMGIKNSQLALRWILDTIGFSCALFGAKTEKQVTENLGAVGWSLNENDLQKIELILNGKN